MNLSSLSLSSIISDDLAYFLHLDYIDLSDNLIRHETVLEDLGMLPRVPNLKSEA